MAYSFFRSKVQPEASEDTHENEALLREIRQVCEEMRCSDMRFSLAEDDSLIEACIYERESLRARYCYLLRCARERGITHLPYHKESRQEEAMDMG
ncbi:MAG: DUF2508 family protein [Clostridiales bacterium]|nr:DUF2508 family protein [Clostridiales bacterium]